MVDFVDRQRDLDAPLGEEYIFDRFLPKGEDKKLIYKENYKSPILEKQLKEYPNKNIIEYPLRQINSNLLERDDTDRRIDDFIFDTLRRGRQRDERIELPLRNIPLEPREQPAIRTSFVSATGLTATTRYNSLAIYRIEGQEVEVSDGKLTEIHFTPDGRNAYDPKKTTDSLSMGITGITQLIEAVDRQRFEVAEYLVGVTNINMALIAQRLGFVITDDCRTADGNINKDLALFKIVGKFSDIRARVEQFKASGNHEKLMRRSQRLKPNPQPA